MATPPTGSSRPTLHSSSGQLPVQSKPGQTNAWEDTPLGSSTRRVTEILAALERGEPGSGEELLPLVYDELRRLARSRMARERPGQTLVPTALVHEVYLRLIGDASDSWSSRAHFFGAAAEAMRRILIERARGKARLKRGGGRHRTTLDERYGASDANPTALLDLDRALTGLEAQDPEMASVVKLRYFSGFTVPETADILGISPRAVNRRWTSARAWLLAQMSDRADSTSGDQLTT